MKIAFNESAGHHGVDSLPRSNIFSRSHVYSSNSINVASRSFLQLTLLETIRTLTLQAC